MSKKIIAAVIVVAVLAGGYFILNSKHKMAQVAFSEFVKQGGSYSCDVRQEAADVDNGGTVYIDSGNIRGDFSTIAEGRTMQSSFLMKDGYTYNWSGAMGVKMKVGDISPEAQATYSWNAGQVGDYTCQPWKADQSKFDVPAGVTFSAAGAVSSDEGE